LANVQFDGGKGVGKELIGNLQDYIKLKDITATEIVAKTLRQYLGIPDTPQSHGDIKPKLEVLPERTCLTTKAF